MSEDRQTQAEKVIHYYNATAGDYKRFWTGEEDLALHFGFYDASVSSHSASLLKMNEVLASYANITVQEQVLDAGCGYGGSAVWLAKHIGCHVVGITLVPAQLEEARRFAEKHQVVRNVRFEQMDYTHTSFPDSSFDVVWALESLVHTDRKQDFIREAYRVLRPGGRLLIAEYMLRDPPPLSEQEQASLSAWLEGWAMASLLTVRAYTGLLAACHFHQVQAYDITEQIRLSVNRLGKLGVPTLPTATLALLLGRMLCSLKMVREARIKNIEAGICQNKALRLGVWKYMIIVAAKGRDANVEEV